MKKRLQRVSLVFGFLVMVASVHGQGLLSTLGSSTSGHWPVELLTLAQQFTTGSSADAIDSVSIDTYFSGASASDLTIGIYSDASGSPGSLLSNGSMSAPGGSFDGSVLSYSASGLTLDANTTYWVIFSSTSSDTVGIMDGAPIATSTDGWSLGAFGYSAGGAYNFGASGTANPLFSINQLQPVPEPGALSVASLGVGLVLALKKTKPNQAKTTTRQASQRK